MNLAYKKILGKFTKVLGFGKTPPPCWEKFPNNIVFFMRAYLTEIRNVHLSSGQIQSINLYDWLWIHWEDLDKAKDIWTKNLSLFGSFIISFFCVHKKC